MIYAYTTEKQPQNQVVEAFAESANARMLHVKHFLHSGIPADASAVIFAGILHGNSRILKECKSKKIDYYYIDHAYFNSGYAPPTWMRITKNGFVQNNTVNNDSERWDRYFNKPLKAYNYQKNPNILILPPSDAVTRTFNCHAWLKTVIRNIRLQTDRPIIVRQKSGPVLDSMMIKTIKRNTYNYNQTINEQISKAYCVVSYNSNVAIDALLQGIPVICSENCAAYPLSNRIENIENLLEYKRLPLMHSLGWGQYNLSEVKDGTAFRNINTLKQVFRA